MESHHNSLKIRAACIRQSLFSKAFYLQLGGVATPALLPYRHYRCRTPVPGPRLQLTVRPPNISIIVSVTRLM